MYSQWGGNQSLLKVSLLYNNESANESLIYPRSAFVKDNAFAFTGARQGYALLQSSYIN